MTEFRVALVGLGRAAKNIHIPALRKIAEAKVVGGFDPVEQRHPFPTFRSLDEMLSARPDIVIVATPPDTHAAITIAALEAGAHFFC
jgi:predicted dehydrogenase